MTTRRDNVSLRDLETRANRMYGAHGGPEYVTTSGEPDGGLFPRSAGESLDAASLDAKAEAMRDRRYR